MVPEPHLWLFLLILAAGACLLIARERRVVVEREERLGSALRLGVEIMRQSGKPQLACAKCGWKEFRLTSKGPKLTTGQIAELECTHCGQWMVVPR